MIIETLSTWKTWLPDFNGEARYFVNGATFHYKKHMMWTRRNINDHLPGVYPGDVVSCYIRSRSENVGWGLVIAVVPMSVPQGDDRWLATVVWNEPESEFQR